MRYTSGAECHIHINHQWARCVESIRYTENIRKRPFFGARSKLLSTMSTGSLEVSGSLVVFHDQTAQFEKLVLGATQVKESFNEAVWIAGAKKAQAEGNTAAIFQYLNQAVSTPPGTAPGDGLTLENLIATLNSKFDETGGIDVEQNYIPTFMDPESMKFPIRSIKIRYAGGETEDEIKDVYITGKTTAIQNGVQTGSQSVMNAYSFIGVKVE